MALREIGFYSLGDTIADDVMQEALLAANSIRASWSLTVKNNEPFDQTFTPTGNQMSISLGTDGTTPGDIATRPAKITQISIFQGPYGVNIPIPVKSYEEFRKNPLQNFAAVPNSAYIDTMYPYQHVWLYPGITPGWSIRVMGLKHMEEYESAQDPFIDPPEYFLPLYKALALELAPKYGQNLPDASLQQLRSALKPLKATVLAARLKTAANGLKTSPGTGFNFFAGF